MNTVVQSVVEPVSGAPAIQEVELNWGRACVGFVSSTLLVSTFLGLLHAL